MSIIHVRVYYKVCSSTKQNLSMFATTHVGPYPTSMKEVKGECVKNAILSTTKPGKKITISLFHQLLTKQKCF